jgi:hypothetical protein
MGSQSVFVNRVIAAFGQLAGRFGITLGTAEAQRNALIIVLVAAALLVLALIVAVALLPAKRKVVRKRVVRVTRRAVGVQPAAAPTVEATAIEGAPTAIAMSGRRRNPAAVIAVWVVAVGLILLSVVAAYVMTGTNAYCGTTCHGADPHVVAAVKDPHGTCVACHEPDPISGVASRIRMAIIKTPRSDLAALATTQVDSEACLRCHSQITASKLTTRAGVIVSHKEIVAGGYSCTMCHVDVGHRNDRSFAGGMARCTTCHDGQAAKRDCAECHVGGSPLENANHARIAVSDFDYGPAVRVANQDCARCHGAEKECLACHNGLVLPHPKAFVDGGHAPIAAFAGKDRCFKCHSLSWCGDTRCHNGFGAHNESTWPLLHQTGTSAKCGSCHIGWNGQGDFCAVCHKQGTGIRP